MNRKEMKKHVEMMLKGFKGLIEVLLDNDLSILDDESTNTSVRDGTSLSDGDIDLLLLLHRKCSGHPAKMLEGFKNVYPKYEGDVTTFNKKLRPIIKRYCEKHGLDPPKFKRSPPRKKEEESKEEDSEEEDSEDEEKDDDSEDDDSEKEKEKERKKEKKEKKEKEKNKNKRDRKHTQDELEQMEKWVTQKKSPEDAFAMAQKGGYELAFKKYRRAFNDKKKRLSEKSEKSGSLLSSSPAPKKKKKSE